MSNETIKDQVGFIKTLHDDIIKKWEGITKSTSIDEAFWNEVSTLRKSLRDFFQAFGTLSRTDKVKQWGLLNDLSLISTIIEG